MLAGMPVGSRTRRADRRAREAHCGRPTGTVTEALLSSRCSLLLVRAQHSLQVAVALAQIELECRLRY